MGDATGTEADEWRLWRSFLAAQARLARRTDGQLQRDSELSRGEYGAIQAILDAPERRLRIGRIAEQLGWERSRVSHLILRMEQRGLIERDACDNDRRANELSVTRAGRRAHLAATRGHAAEVRRAFLDQVRPEERQMLQAVLDRIIGQSN